MQITLSYIINYIIAFSVGIYLIVYLLKIPYLLGNDPKLINEYYMHKHHTFVPIDAILVAKYLLFSFIFIKLLNTNLFTYKLLIIIATTILTTSIFCFYFTNKKLDKNNIYSRWFHSVGYYSAIYDAILLSIIYIVFNHMNQLVL